MESAICPDDPHIFQPLSPTSFVSRSTEVTISPRRSPSTTKECASFIQISSAGTMPIKIFESTSRRQVALSFDQRIAANNDSETPTTILEFPMPKGGSIQSRPLSMSKDDIVQANGLAIIAGSTWKPPEEWECSTEREQPPVKCKPKFIDLAPQPLRPRRTNTKIKRMKVPSAEMMSLQRNILKMEAASDKIVLERLKEEWPQIVDAAVCRELELEKQLWMLTALRRRPGGKIHEVTEPKSDRILSLFENQGESRCRRS